MMLVKQRETARHLLIEEGLPTKKTEQWHYTNLKNILGSFNFATDAVVLPSAEIELGAELILTNGILTQLPNEPHVACARLTHISERKFNERNLSKDSIGQINTACFTDGASVDISKSLTSPMIINNKFSNTQSHTRLAINIESDATATIIEHHIASNESELSTSVCDINIGENATLNYIVLHRHQMNIVELRQLHASLAKAAQFNLYVVNIDSQAKLRRQELNVSLFGSGADFQLRSINLLEQKAHNDIIMDVRHLAPDTSSKEILRNVVRDSATGVFQGIIRVDQIAQKTDAKMSCNTLVLSDEASFSAKPELEIFADDVACGHGATVAPINSDFLFYLAARGIDLEIAKDILIKAFTQELLSEDKAIAELLSRYIDNEPKQGIS